MTTSNESFYDSISGALTPEQAAQALALADSGDTGASAADQGGAPATTAASVDESAASAGTENEQQQGKADPAKAEGAKDIPEDQQNADNTVVLARDGKHTIGFDQLAKTRQQRDEYKAAAETAQRALADLQAQAQARADAGQAPTKTDNMAATAAAAIEAGADADLFGDFSEQALKAGIEKLVAQQVATQVQAHVAKVVEPLQAKHQQDAASTHFDAIYKAHPNADSIAQSAEFAAWVNAQPSVVRNAYWGLFDPKTGGSADQIVEVFDAYKAASEKPSPQPAAAATKAAAQAAVAQVKTDPPASLSSIPGGHAAGGSALDATADMSGLEMLTATENMSPAQLEAWLNKQI